jgi:hypothetical protein
MSRHSSIEKLPLEIKHWVIRSIVDKTYGDYDSLVSSLEDKGYVVSRSSLWRFAQKLIAQADTLRLIGPNLPADDKATIEQLRLKCLEIAEGDIPEERIAAAERYLAWIFKT